MLSKPASTNDWEYSPVYRVIHLVNVLSENNADIFCHNLPKLMEMTQVVFNPRRKKKGVTSLMCVSVYLCVCLWHFSSTNLDLVFLLQSWPDREMFDSVGGFLKFLIFTCRLQ